MNSVSCCVRRHIAKPRTGPRSTGLQRQTSDAPRTLLAQSAPHENEGVAHPPSCPRGVLDPRFRMTSVVAAENHRKTATSNPSLSAPADRSPEQAPHPGQAEYRRPSRSFITELSHASRVYS